MSSLNQRHFLSEVRLQERGIPTPAPPGPLWHKSLAVCCWLGFDTGELKRHKNHSGFDIQEAGEVLTSERHGIFDLQEVGKKL